MKPKAFNSILNLFLILIIATISAKSNKIVEVVFSSDKCIYSIKLNEVLEQLKPFQQLYCSSDHKISSIDFNVTENLLVWCERVGGIKYAKRDINGQINGNDIKSLTNNSCDNIAYDYKNKRVYYNMLKRRQINAIDFDGQRNSYAIINDSKDIVGDIKLDCGRDTLVWTQWNADETDAQFMISKLNGTEVRELLAEDYLKMPQMFDIDLDNGIIFFIDSEFKSLVSLTYFGETDIIYESSVEFNRHSIDGQMAFCNLSLLFHKLNDSIVAFTAADKTEMNYKEIVIWNSAISALRCEAYQSRSDQNAINESLLTATTTTTTINTIISTRNNITLIVSDNRIGNNSNTTLIAIVITFSLIIIILLSTIILMCIYFLHLKNKRFGAKKESNHTITEDVEQREQILPHINAALEL